MMNKSTLIYVFLLTLACQTFTRAASIAPAYSGYATAVPPGEPIIYEVTNSCSDPGVCMYTYSVENGVIQGNSSGFDQKSVTVIFDNANGNGKVTVSITQCSKACASTSASTQASIKYLGLVGNIKINGTAYTGTYTIACNTTPITVSVDPVVNATSYTWTKPSTGWSITGSGASITLTPDLNTGGNIVVVAKRSDAPAIYTSSGLAIARPLPMINTISNSSMLLCSGTTSSVFGTGTNADQFQWTPSTDVRINGNSSTQTSAGAVTISAVGSGTFTAKAYSTVCAIASTNSLTGIVRFGVPYVYYPVQTLMDAGTNMYQLSYDNLRYAPVTSVYTVTSGSASLSPFINDCYASSMGGATIELKSSNACGSAYFTYTIPPAGSMLMAYPNPASDQLTLKLSNAETEAFIPESINLISESSAETVRHIDVQKVFKSKQFVDGNKLLLDVKSLPRGIYYIEMIPNASSKQKAEKIRLKLD